MNLSSPPPAGSPPMFSSAGTTPDHSPTSQSSLLMTPTDSPIPRVFDLGYGSTFDFERPKMSQDWALPFTTRATKNVSNVISPPSISNTFSPPSAPFLIDNPQSFSPNRSKDLLFDPFDDQLVPQMPTAPSSTLPGIPQISQPSVYQADGLSSSAMWRLPATAGPNNLAHADPQLADFDLGVTPFSNLHARSQSIQSNYSVSNCASSVHPHDVCSIFIFLFHFPIRPVANHIYTT
jgi:hypothetical protein